MTGGAKPATLPPKVGTMKICARLLIGVLLTATVPEAAWAEDADSRAGRCEGAGERGFVALPGS